MSSRTSPVPVPVSEIKFAQGGPSITGATSVTPCFPGEQGRLYKLERDDEIFFYNDTLEYEAHVTGHFGPDSRVAPGPRAAEPAADDDGHSHSGWHAITLIVYPGETLLLASGRVDGLRTEFEMRAVSEERLAAVAKEMAFVTEGAIQQLKALGVKVTNEEEVIAQCIKSNTPFVDLSFPPRQRSLSRPNDERDLAPTPWRRPGDFLPAELAPRLFKGGVEPDDIDQGQLGDCWFLCAVASLAEFPGKISDMFTHPVSEEKAEQERRVGCYRVTLNKNGWWRIVVVDDFLPCVGTRPCFAKNKEDPAELWASLLEKAYAKVSGSYASIMGGDALHALQDLTGYPTTRLDRDWIAAQSDRGGLGARLFSDLLTFDQEKYLISVNTPSVSLQNYVGGKPDAKARALEEKYKKVGLALGHAYSVIEVREFAPSAAEAESHSGAPLRLLKVRNPWGGGEEWSGAWSDNSPLWEQRPDVAAACGHEAGSDGTFWMAWSDALEYFDGCGVCYTKFDWHDYRVAVTFNGNTPDMMLEVHAREEFEAFVVISQIDRRTAGQADSEELAAREADAVGDDDERANLSTSTPAPIRTPALAYSPALISIAKPEAGRDPARYVNDVNSSADALKPTPCERFEYVMARDVSVKYTFTPTADGRPYYVVPRMQSMEEGKQVTVAIIASKPLRPDGNAIKFRTVEARHPALQNRRGFTLRSADVLVAPPRQYQYNPEVGCPVTAYGSEIATPAAASE